jgi:hypothetical protein
MAASPKASEPRPKDPTTGAHCRVAARGSASDAQHRSRMSQQSILSAAPIDRSGERQVSITPSATILRGDPEHRDRADILKAWEPVTSNELP